MRKIVIFVLLMVLLISCNRYRKGQTVSIKLGGSKGIIVKAEFDGRYEVRYLDHNGVYQLSKFDESEINRYYIEDDTIQSHENDNRNNPSETDGFGMEKRKGN